MIRVNAFFELKDEVSVAELTALSAPLVELSRADEGCRAYDLFQSTTSVRVFMFCETWESEACLERHSQQPHFTTAVPQIERLTKNGMKLERFEM